MTFEEWFVKRFSNPDDECYIFAKEAWNAAINSSIRSVGSVSGDNTEELHVLKKLLTS